MLTSGSRQVFVLWIVGVDAETNSASFMGTARNFASKFRLYNSDMHEQYLLESHTLNPRRQWVMLPEADVVNCRKQFCTKCWDSRVEKLTILYRHLQVLAAKVSYDYTCWLLYNWKKLFGRVSLASALIRDHLIQLHDCSGMLITSILSCGIAFEWEIWLHWRYMSSFGQMSSDSDL